MVERTKLESLLVILEQAYDRGDGEAVYDLCGASPCTYVDCAECPFDTNDSLGEFIEELKEIVNG